MESPCGAGVSVTLPSAEGRAGLIQPAGLARPQPGLMEIENIIQYAPFAFGLMLSAMQGEARLRWLWRNNYSKTIHRLWTALRRASTCVDAATATA